MLDLSLFLKSGIKWAIFHRLRWRHCFKERLNNLVNGYSNCFGGVHEHSMTNTIWSCSFINFSRLKNIYYIWTMSRFSKMASILFSKLGIGTFLSSIVDIEERETQRDTKREKTCLGIGLSNIGMSIAIITCL